MTQKDKQKRIDYLMDIAGKEQASKKCRILYRNFDDGTGHYWDDDGDCVGYKTVDGFIIDNKGRKWRDNSIKVTLDTWENE